MFYNPFTSELPPGVWDSAPYTVTDNGKDTECKEVNIIFLQDSSVQADEFQAISIVRFGRLDN
jgi:hypothetical protein